MKTLELQIRSLKITVYLLFFTVVMLVWTNIRSGYFHHVEEFRFDDDVVVVTVEGNNSLGFLFPFRQSISIDRMSPSFPDNKDRSLSKEEHQQRVAAAWSTKTPVRNWQGSFKGPGILSPFLRKQEGTQSYEVANVCENMKRLVRDPEGNWAVEPAQGQIGYDFGKPVAK